MKAANILRWGGEPQGLGYGYLYNWYAVVDSRNVCPVDWHVPSDTEWTVLTDYLGGTPGVGKKMKEAGLVHWNSPNTGATNESGFSGLPGGFRNGPFYNLGNLGFWWSATDSSTYLAPGRYLTFNNSLVSRNYYIKESGFSVRCVRD